ncbi:MAG: hypothetical protein Q8P67_20590, partial [archaeon]|nr:hypothetical protein [archaeon]
MVGHRSHDPRSNRQAGRLSRTARLLGILVLAATLFSVTLILLLGEAPAVGDASRHLEDGGTRPGWLLRLLGDDAPPTTVISPPSINCSISCDPLSQPPPGALVPATTLGELFSRQGSFEAWVLPNGTSPLSYHPVFAKDDGFGFGLFALIGGGHEVAFFFGDLSNGTWASISTPSAAIP